MPERDILRELGIDVEDVEREVEESLQGLTGECLETQLDESVRDYTPNTVLEGRIVNILGDDVMVDVGYKSEGVIPKYEWEDPSQVQVGQAVEVLLEAVEDDMGLVQLSKRKADRLRAWERIVALHEESDVVTGRVMRKIKGGLLVDIGVPVFLPASQVDIRRPGEIADFIGKQLTCKILKIDKERRNIVVSRRQLIEAQREIMKRRMFDVLEPGQIRTGRVKNIVDFGAFVDLGGMDGLLHITDMSWGRISHPSEIVAIDDELEVKILGVDRQGQKVALGLKQKTPSPWEDIEEKYPVGSTVRGEAVNLMNYGAFVKLEEGVEGLVHISEMSWTRRINHPAEMVAIGDVVDVVVLGINKEKEEISLGMKQIDQNPWELVAENYPAGTRVVGKVRNLTNYGAFIEIEEGIDGLLHVSDMSWTKKVMHPSEFVNKGEAIETIVLEVNPDRRRLALGLKQLQPDPWHDEIPSRYRAGDIVRGRVSKLASFGAFVELEGGLEGLLHISELSDKKINSPEEIVKVSDIVDVRVIRVDPEGRKIGLSLRKDVEGPTEEEQPGIVIRSEELEEAENPDQMVKKALDEAPQFEDREEEKESEPDAHVAQVGGLAIPREVALSEPEQKEDEEETGADVRQETSEGAIEAPAEPEQKEDEEETGADVRQETSEGAIEAPAEPEQKEDEEETGADLRQETSEGAAEASAGTESAELREEIKLDPEDESPEQ